MTTNNTANTSKTTDLVFRTKFEKLLNEQTRPIIQSLFEAFLALEPNAAIQTLWKLTYAADIPAVLDELGVDPESLVFDDNGGLTVVVLRNEMRFQYSYQLPYFLDAPVAEECQSEYTALVNQSDAITAYIVYEQVSRHLYLDASALERILYLLKSEQENHFFGGIRSLGFYPEEANYLKVFHSQIHDLLNALYQCKKAIDEQFKKSPFADLDKRLKAAGHKLSSDVTSASPEKPTLSKGNKAVTEDSHKTSKSKKLSEFKKSQELPEVKKSVESSEITEAQVTPKTQEVAEVRKTVTAPESDLNSGKFVPLTLDTILAHKDAFTAFAEEDNMSVFPMLHQLGFDLNEVMDKRTKISGLLKAIREF